VLKSFEISDRLETTFPVGFIKLILITVHFLSELFIASALHCLITDRALKFKLYALNCLKPYQWLGCAPAINSVERK